MSLVRQALVVGIGLSTVAFTSTAMAGKGGVKGPNSDAPGQANSSPGQVWTSQKSIDPSALPPGQQYNQDRSLNSLTPALPPGQTFGTPGNRIPGSLP
jgi:hypothetical protein